jgi:Kef-type K+ transport system membrane component KefB
MGLFEHFISSKINELPPLVTIGFLLLASFSGGELASRLKAPRVIGYLVTGILTGIVFKGPLHNIVFLHDLNIVTQIALAIIAFSIGGSLELSKIKRLGGQILTITIFQAFGAFLLATIATGVFLLITECSFEVYSCFISAYFPFALVIGAISAATAPAATLAIIHEYRAKGPFTTTLLGVVALDDALTIFIYAFAASIAHSLIGGGSVTIASLFAEPLYSVFVSILSGLAMGMIIKAVIRYIRNREIMLGVIIGGIFLTSGIAEIFEGHAIMANMVLGFIVINFVEHHNDIFSVVESVEEPFFGLFFTLAGTHFDLKLMQAAGILALIITLSRFAGKIFGSAFGSQISHAPANVRKYLGLALLPTAGVTVGLAFDAQAYLGEAAFSEIMLSAVLGSVLLNEFMTPFIVKSVLYKCGEAGAS